MISHVIDGESIPTRFFTSRSTRSFECLIHSPLDEASKQQSIREVPFMEMAPLIKRSLYLITRNSVQSSCHIVFIDYSRQLTSVQLSKSHINLVIASQLASIVNTMLFLSMVMINGLMRYQIVSLFKSETRLNGFSSD